MNLDNFKSLVPEDKRAEFTQALEAFVAEQKRPLEVKRDELLGKLNKVKDAERAAQEAAELERVEKLKTSNDIESIRKQYQELLDAQTRKTTELTQSLVNRELQASLQSAINGADGIAELLEPHLKSRVKAEMIEGVTKLTVLNADGTPKIGANGQPASVADLVGEFKSNTLFAGAFRAQVQTGAGAKASEKATAAKNPWSKGSRNLTEQARLAAENPNLAKKLAAEAGITLDI